MDGNTSKDKAPTIRAHINTLERFEQKIADSCLARELTKDMVALTNDAQKLLRKEKTSEADLVLGRLLLMIKVNIGTEINLRLASELATTLVEDVRRYIADPAHLYSDAVVFSESYLLLHAETPSVDKPPQYLVSRSFPGPVSNAASQVKSLIRSYELPRSVETGLYSDIDMLQKTAAKVRRGKPSRLQSQQSLESIASIYVTLSDVKGTYLTARQFNTILGIILFAWPKWLCWNPIAWAVQAAIFLFGLIAGIASTAAAKKAINYIWTYIADCQVSIKAVRQKVQNEMDELDQDEKDEVVAGLKKMLKNFKKLLYPGSKGKVHNKLKAAIREAESIASST